MGGGGRLPAFLYEILPPHIYLIVGAVAATGVEPNYGRIAGIMLAVAGVIIYRLRMDYRTGAEMSAASCLSLRDCFCGLRTGMQPNAATALLATGWSSSPVPMPCLSLASPSNNMASRAAAESQRAAAAGRTRTRHTKCFA